MATPRGSQCPGQAELVGLPEQLHCLIQLTGPADSSFYQEARQLSPDVRLAIEIRNFNARLQGQSRSVDTEGTFESTFRLYIPDGG
jgi:hypothetical protein